MSSQMNNSGQLNSFKFGEKVIKADYSPESDRVTGFLLANISLWKHTCFFAVKYWSELLTVSLCVRGFKTVACEQQFIKM